MWIFLNDSYFSIVHKDCRLDEVLIRARRKGDIECLFPRATVISVDHADYQYRATVTRKALATVIAHEIENIKYPNFKDSVKDPTLRAMYSKVWAESGGWARYHEWDMQ